MLKYVISMGSSRNKELFFSEVESLVRSWRLAKEIQLIKVEKGSKHFQFYYGLGIVTEDIDKTAINDPSSDLYKFLRENVSKIGSVSFSPGTKSPHLYTEDEIKGFLTGKLEWKNFNYDIRYEFDDIESGNNDFRIEYIQENENQILGSENFQKLLWWASAYGGGSFESFDNACKELELIGEYRSAWTILRSLVNLGHAEIIKSDNGIHWKIRESMLIKHADGSNFSLIGKQTPAFIESLYKEAGVSKEDIIENDFSISFNSDSESINDLSLELIDSNHSALVDSIPSINKWMENIDEDIYISKKATVENTSFYLFDGKNFKKYPDQKERTLGLYRIDKNGFSKYRFFDGGKWVNSDLTDLKYLDYHFKEANKKARYDSNERSLYVEERFKWPQIYEQILISASCKLPKRFFSGGRSLLKYENISNNLMQIISEKLKIQITTQ